MANNVNSFGVFLENLQRAGLTEGGRTRSAAPPAVDTDATERIMQALRDKSVVDPSGLGLNYVELGHAVERLLSLQAVTTAEENGRQVICRGDKFDDVRFLLKLL
jgi:hypothetical protein